MRTLHTSREGTILVEKNGKFLSKYQKVSKKFFFEKHFERKQKVCLVHFVYWQKSEDMLETHTVYHPLLLGKRERKI